LLFNIKEDPEQEHPLEDEALNEKMCRQLAAFMREADAPEEQFLRMGLTE
jgi:hypothetical protein